MKRVFNSIILIGSFLAIPLIIVQADKMVSYEAPLAEDAPTVMPEKGGNVIAAQKAVASRGSGSHSGGITRGSAVKSTKNKSKSNAEKGSKDKKSGPLKASEVEAQNKDKEVPINVDSNSCTAYVIFRTTDWRNDPEEGLYEARSAIEIIFRIPATKGSDGKLKLETSGIKIGFSRLDGEHNDKIFKIGTKNDSDLDLKKNFDPKDADILKSKLLDMYNDAKKACENGKSR